MVRLIKAAAVMAAAFILPVAACAQGGVVQFGVVTPGHGVQWGGNGVIADTGQPWNTGGGSTGCPTAGCTFTGPVIFGAPTGNPASGTGWSVDGSGNVTANSVTSAAGITGQFYASGVVSSLTATGSSQVSAFDLTASSQGNSFFSNVAAGTGAALSSNVPIGAIVSVYNTGSNPLLLYPPIGSGSSIDGLGPNAPVTVPVAGLNTRASVVTLLRQTSGLWASVNGANAVNFNKISTPGQVNANVFAASTVPGLTATGSNQATAYNMTTQTGGQYTLFSTVAAGTGVGLSANAPYGSVLTIVNQGASNLLVYPPIGTSDTIDNLSAGLPVTLPAWVSVPGVSALNAVGAFLHVAPGVWQTLTSAPNGVFKQVFVPNGQVNAGIYAEATIVGLTATGTNHATAYNMTSSPSQATNVFGTVAAGTGAALSADIPYGGWQSVINEGLNDLHVYPPIGSSDVIDTASSVTVVAGIGSVRIQHVQNGDWRRVACTPSCP